MQVLFFHCLSHFNQSYLQLFESTLHPHPFPGEGEIEVAIHLVHLEKTTTHHVFRDIEPIFFGVAAVF